MGRIEERKHKVMKGTVGGHECTAYPAHSKEKKKAPECSHN